MSSEEASAVRYDCLSASYSFLQCELYVMLTLSFTATSRTLCRFLYGAHPDRIRKIYDSSSRLKNSKMLKDRLMLTV